MPISALTITAGGEHHASATGQIDLGAGAGQVAAFGANVAMFISLTPYTNLQGIILDNTAQIEWTFQALDANLTRVIQDAVTPYTIVGGVPTQANFNIDITAAANVNVLVNAVASSVR